MKDSLLGELQEKEAKQAVIDTTIALFERWHLHPVNQAQLLGLPRTSDLKTQGPEAIDSAVFARMGNILAIDRSLNTYFRYEPQNRDQWIFQPLQQLQGETPLAVMLNLGDTGIRKIRQLAESLLEY